MYFFFNEPATTEIYTYRHTLSLHDALPISPDREWERFVDLRFRLNPDLPRSARLMLSLERDIDDDDVLKISCRKPLSLYVTREMTRPGMDGLQRSEEHTSELQSLMRISYAVFCLKKKNHTRQTKHKR